MKRALSFILAFVMVISFAPTVAFAAESTTKTIYLNTGGSSMWNQGNAWFDAWVWGSSKADAWYTFTDDDADGIYSVEVPADATGMKILRKDPASSSQGWNCWNQTNDLTIGTNNCYTITAWGNNTDVCSGQWSTIVPPAPTYHVAGTKGLTGADWDTTKNQMSDADGDGVYELTFTGIKADTYEFKIAVNGNWDVSWGVNGGNTSVTVAEDNSNVTVKFNPSTKAVTATAAVEYEVTFNGTNVTSGGATKAVKGTDYTATLTAAEGFDLPESITVTVAGAAVNGYTYAGGELTIPARLLTGNVVITAEGVKKVAEPKTIYLNAGGKNLWDQGAAWFTAWAWGSSNDADAWFTLTDEDADGIYQAEIPGGYTNIKFYRMDPAQTTPNADNGVWNKTDDLTVGGNCYTITGWGGADGTWSTQTITPADVTYTVVGAGGLCGSEWDVENTANDMTKNAETGLYEKVFTNVVAATYEYKIAANHSWEKSWGVRGKNDNMTVTVAEDGSTVTITFNAATRVVDATVTAPPAGGDEGGDGGDDVKNTYTTVFHFANTIGWSPLNLYVWNDDGATTGSWPGSAITKQDDNGYHTATVSWEAASNKGLNYIFNNGSVQTVDLSLSADLFDAATNTAEVWVQLDATANSDGKYVTKQVETKELGIALAVSPRVSGTSVTFEYAGNSNTTSVEVRGTVTGSTWEKGISMSKNAKGIWTVTVENLSPAVYQYKFVVNGSEWTTDPANGKTNSEGNSVFTIVDPDAVDTNQVTINVYYDRADGIYTLANADGTETGTWNAYVWGDNIAGTRYDFAKDANGKMVTTIKVVGRDAQNVYLKPRMSTPGKEWLKEESQVSIPLDNIVSGTINVYVVSDGTDGNAGNMTYSVVHDTDIVTSNKLTDLQLDYDTGTVTVTTMEALNDPETDLVIENTEDSTDDIKIESIKTSGNTYTLTLSKEPDLVNLYKYQIKYNGYYYEIGIDTVYASDKFATEYTYTTIGNELGATYSAGSTTFKVWAPTAEAVKVNLYKSGTAGTDDRIDTVAMAGGTKDDKGIWTVTVNGDLNGTYYTYSIKVDGEEVEAVDPYARTTGVNGNRGMVIDLDSTDPTGWDSDTNPNPITSYTDAVIYELHVRDFSIDDSSGVKDEWQGKYMAFTQTGTTVDGKGEISTGIDYLKDLGITHVHLLPVYDYASVEETTSNTFNWGYDPQNYNTPEGSYSTDPYNGEVRVKEFKQMVQSLHSNGISVIMDVVYNHVYNADTFCFNNIVPGYFSRVDSNRSGCGNDTASEREMVRKYIVESVVYWATEYHIDGFRFDLVGLLDVETINQIVSEVHERAGSDIIFYGEGWDMDDTNKEPGTVMAKQGNASKTEGFAYFSDSMRNLLGGDNGKSTGFVSGSTGREGEIVSNFMANPWWTSNPQQVVQYASCHDNYTLVDKLIKSTGASGVTPDIIKMNNLAAAVYMTSQGIPFIHAGEEILREKVNESGNRVENSYNASDYVNHIEWSDLENATYKANSEYYKGLIAFRKAHPALSLSSSTDVKASVKAKVASGNIVAFAIDGYYSGDDDIYVIFNANSSAETVSLPEGEWTMYINGTKAGTTSLGTANGTVSVDGISAMVLTKKDEGKDAVDLTETVTLYFSNNKGWENVYAYAWVGETRPAGDWPGKEMTYVETNDYGEKIYGITVPAACEGVIFHNNSGEQTVDVAPGMDGTGYYLTDKNSDNKWEVGTYTYRAPSIGDSSEYYLVGYINGTDYVAGDYKFDENGKLTATFNSDSYVYVRNGDSSAEYWTDGYLGTVTSATLKDNRKCSLTADKWDKMLIPGGVEVTITLTVNNDNTVTLSYETASSGGFEDKSGVQDGVTLHCWNWSFAEIEANMAKIAEQGYTAIQTSPVQAMKEATNLSTNSVGTHWWVYYQPVDFKITTDDGNALGTKSDLESMIETAHKYGIKVIVDVVANHLGNETGNDLSSKIPDEIRNNTNYWHDITTNITNWNDRENMTQYCMSGLPDLNTANDDIQDYVLTFLKECIDIGVDGFRFDAAKSIETPKDDASFASDFWPTVVHGAEEYAQTKYSKDLYLYGEVLDNPAIAISAYTEYMAVTDNSWGNNLRGSIASGTASIAVGYHKAADASQLVVWAESHDTYADGTSSGVSEENINKTWALVAARADAMGLYLARPESMSQALGTASVTGWANAEVKAVNEFHNAFAGKDETVGSSGNIAYVVRGTTGVVLVNAAGASATISGIELGMTDGTYTDQITGKTFTVANGKISGKIGETGIAVVYNVKQVVTENNVTVKDTNGGKVIISDETPKTGATVTITATPDSGKAVDKITVTDKDGKAVTVKDNGNGTYSFTQPDGDVIVEVTFKTASTGTVTKYNVTVKDTTGGKVEVSTKTAEAGATVTITVKADSGKVVDKITVTDKDGKAVTVKSAGDGTYTFEQPDSDVSISVTFKNKQTSSTGDNAATGDNSQLGMWIGLMMISILMIALLLIIKRKQAIAKR